VTNLNVVNGVITNTYGGNGIYFYFDPAKNLALGQYPLADGGFAPAGQNPIPTPGALWLLGSGIVRLATLRRRFRV
jgi:hypothetical protein